MRKKEKMIRVVVAEDHEALRMLTRDVLERSNRFQVVGEAVNGEEAVELARTESPDLVLLDLKMPVRDGFQALPEILAVAPHAKVVAYSMLDRPALEAKALQLGAVAFIEKDADSADMVARLLALFDGQSDRVGGGGPPPRHDPPSRTAHNFSWTRLYLPRATAARL